jgi:hypothetical protein
MFSIDVIVLQVTHSDNVEYSSPRTEIGNR